MSSSGTVVSWVQWFCSNRGNEFYCEVDEDYISDNFNLTGLNEFVPRFFRESLDKILDLEPDDSHDEGSENAVEVARNAEKLYGLIHARFILTTKGLNAMTDKMNDGDFGTCPREKCNNNYLLPIGLSDMLGQAYVKMYCSACNDIYMPKHARHHFLDGAFFGTSFPQMLLMVCQNYHRPPRAPKFEPRLYGFKIHPRAIELQHQAQEEHDKNNHNMKNNDY